MFRNIEMSAVSETNLKDVFALFDRSAKGAVPASDIGDLLRAVGHNPTQADIAKLQDQHPKEIDFNTFKALAAESKSDIGKPEDYIKAFQIFDRDMTGFISLGELKYILTSIGEPLSETEVSELLKNVQVKDEQVDYADFVKSILAQ